MLTHDNRWSLPRGNPPVPSRWQATFDEEVRGMTDAGRVRESDSALVISDPVRVG
jgi:hypothetical protein